MPFPLHFAQFQHVRQNGDLALRADLVHHVQRCDHGNGAGVVRIVDHVNAAEFDRVHAPRVRLDLRQRLDCLGHGHVQRKPRRDGQRRVDGVVLAQHRHGIIQRDVPGLQRKADTARPFGVDVQQLQVDAVFRADGEPAEVAAGAPHDLLFAQIIAVRVVDQQIVRAEVV